MKAPTNTEPKQFSPPLDPEIEAIVLRLMEDGVETFESCQGGPGHAYPERAVRFEGPQSEGFRALAAALQANMPVAELRRVWSINDREPVGPVWELTFSALPWPHRPVTSD